MKKISHPRPSSAPGDLAQACRRQGLTATPQRVAILGALRQALDHPSPEALFDRLKPALPSLSLGTVYKALHQFTAAGLAREVSVAGDNCRRFDGNLDVHHHLVCVVCHRVSDHYDPALDRLAAPSRLPAFRPLALRVDVLGTCAACQGAAPPRHRRPRGAPRA